jgi:hypothetical protein
MIRTWMLVSTAIFWTEASAQNLTSRPETMDYIAQQLAEIDQGVQTLQFADANTDKSYIQRSVEALLEKAADMRDKLRTNPYARITGFSVSVPWGISFEFVFPDDEQPRQ